MTPVSEATPMQLAAARARRERHQRVEDAARRYQQAQAGICPMCGAPQASAPRLPPSCPDENRVERSLTFRGRGATVWAMVCEHYGVSELDLVSHRRPQWITIPRQVAMYLMRHLTPLSYPQIGGVLGGRDHSTVIHGVHRIEERMAENPAFADDVRALRARIEERLG